MGAKVDVCGASWFKRCAARRLGVVAAVTSALLVAGCRESEEERLRKRVNVTDTYLYVAFKLAFGDFTGNTEAKKVRDSVAQLEKGLRTVSEGIEKRTLVEAQNLTAAADVALGLWSLREEGRAEVEKWRTSRLSVFSKEELGSDEQRALATEHAALLLLLVAMKLHPSAPVPVPETAVLYEAYLLGQDPIAIGELEGLARSAQAIAFSGEQYCEMAEVSTARLAQLAPAKALVPPQEFVGMLGGAGFAAAHAGEGALYVAAAALATQLPWAMRMLAFAKTASCLSDSSLPDADVRAAAQWERAIEVAEQAGFAAPELAFLRAYLAYKRSDFERVQQELRRAKESTLLTSNERQQLDQLVEHFDPNERGAIDDFMDPLFVSHWVVRLVHHRLQEAGFYDQLSRIPAVEVVTHVFNSVSLPNQDSAKQAGGDLLQWLKSKWPEFN